ncbi:MAG: nucleotide exchange factor GrpE [Dehalococcoidales bacterium]|jgi:molecular chaperone GrpE|nr:nucleotide exchange factor GrpE [Dehalococcoidales bacterium]MDP6576987.1 nucleotide exchange factor GrpE [Dehalococcoidales bacterium]MDP6824592.1 nucleotide exchange factor GrpE [Dehalococcoidales bacterium]|tara:strand:+ start:61 stop:609 length:549 start_codon:yes stop_codon:yes gene_type:complete
MMPPEAEENINNETAPEVPETEGVEGLKQALDEEKKKAEIYLTSWQRAQADFVNYKRRHEQDRQEFRQFANTDLILGLLPVLDDLERALNSTAPKPARHSWIDGVRMIIRKFQATLEARGLTPIEALGKPFDPNQHEAVRQAKGAEGIVIEEVRKGYKLHDRVIRPTMAVVGHGEEAEKEDK